jgi:phosphatidylglycerophosphate synthase
VKKHIGSYLSTVLGTLLIFTGLGQLEMDPQWFFNLLLGITILAGSLAYRSAKKRKQSEVPNSKLRVILEAMVLVAVGFLIFGLSDYTKLAMTNPAVTILAPAWVLIAYLFVNLRKSDKDKS